MQFIITAYQQQAHYLFHIKRMFKDLYYVHMGKYKQEATELIWKIVTSLLTLFLQQNYVFPHSTLNDFINCKARELNDKLKFDRGL